MTTHGASRYDAVIATLVGFCALFLSGYTAYMHRQQVRAAVWPILEFDSGNDPDISFHLSNKGVGPAMIRHVIVQVDGQSAVNWREALEKLLGPGKHRYSQSNMTGRLLSAGESLTVLTPRDPDGNPLTVDKPAKANPLWVKMDKDRERIAVEICYCSALGDCWTLRSGATTPNSTTTETRHCPSPSATSFQQ